VIVHGITGDGLGLGFPLGDGLGDADATGLALGEGDAVGKPPPMSGNGDGVTSGTTGTIGDAVGLAEGVVLDAVGTGVAPAARSATWRLTFGTLSSKTALSIVTSPEPVISTESESSLLRRRTET